MLFLSKNKWRRVSVRLFAGVMIFALVFFIWDFSRSEKKSLDSFCEECTYSKYVSDFIPEKTIALTFDNILENNNGREILDLLEKKEVNATFFLTGSNMLKKPWLVRDIVSSGHFVGNQGYSGVKISKIQKKEVFWQLNKTNSIFENLTGRTTVLYRPGDLFATKGVVRPVFNNDPTLKWIRSAGYVPIGTDLNIEVQKEKSEEESISDFRALLEKNELRAPGKHGHVLLLEGEKLSTGTLVSILDILEKREYKIVSLPSLLGMEKEVVMPYATGNRAELFSFVVFIFSMFWPILFGFMIFITFFSILRPMVFLGIRRFKKSPNSNFVDFGREESKKRTSLIVPVHNEEMNIQGTIQSILGGSVIPDEIVIIDDGSTDKTAFYARQLKMQYPDLISVYSYPNRGKAGALNRGILKATGDVVITIDGDSVLDVDAVKNILPSFMDPEVGAVAGKVVPARAVGFFERIQNLEYLVGQNIDKEALSKLCAVNVVPGALGAWRRSLILSLGSYSNDTLVEDQDLTLAVLGVGKKVLYEPTSISYTEVPVTGGAFFKQRLRWMFGTFQCVYKHRKSIFNRETPRAGFIALPYAFIVNVFFPIVLSFVYVSVAISIFFFSLLPIIYSLVFYAFFDVSYAFLAISRESRPQWKDLLLIIPQRLIFMGIYGVLTASVLMKISDGSGTRWHHLRRRGVAEAHYRSGGCHRIFKTG